MHLEGGGDRLDQHRGADRPLGDAERVLGEDEDVVPEPRLQVALELRQIEVRARAVLEPDLRVVEEVQAEVEDRTGNSLQYQP